MYYIYNSEKFENATAITLYGKFYSQLQKKTWEIP
jgi:hypothetical protein